VERTLLAAVSRGHCGLPHWHRHPRELDFYDLKGILEGLVERALGEPALLTPPGAGAATEFLDPLAAAHINIHGDTLGWIGRLAPTATAAWDLPGDILAFELDLTEVPPAPPLAQNIPLPRHPAAERDLAIILPAEVQYHSLEALLCACGENLLESVSLFDRYQGSPIPAGRVSLAVRLTFRAADRTLTAPEVQHIVDTMVSRLRTELGGEIRDT
jgi:phenylalanyl-tRNA synthetase beta chain